MNPRTTEIIKIPDFNAFKDQRPQQPRDYDIKEYIHLKEPITDEEIKMGHAGFKTWSGALDLNLSTRQLRRKAERRYKKAVKKFKTRNEA